jgi:ubiquinone/menaquinone biosynthesis C-methylase UbiE
MVLHHTFKPEKIISEASRVLRKGGILLIREHDIDSDTDIDGKTFLDILHGLYCISWAKYGEQENPNFCNNYYGVYQSRDNWNNIVLQYNLELQLTNEDLKYFYNICKVKREYVNYKWIKNPYHYYYALYTKK